MGANDITGSTKARATIGGTDTPKGRKATTKGTATIPATVDAFRKENRQGKGVPDSFPSESSGTTTAKAFQQWTSPRQGNRFAAWLPVIRFSDITLYYKL